MSVTLAEVKRAARAHRAPLAGESAGYLVLALADQVSSAPRLMEAGDIQLTEDGGLRVLRGQASSESDAELSLRRALDDLLLVASSGSAALMRAGRRVAPVGLPGLVRELEAALIPVNRAAARRALARLHRETVRALASGELAEEPLADAPIPAVPVAALPIAQPVLAAPPIAQPMLAAAIVLDAQESEESEESEEPETRAIAVPVPAFVDLPPALTSLDGVVSALCAESDESASSPVSDALTVALDVRAGAHAVPNTEMILQDEDVEFMEEEPSEALTVARNIDVQPIANAALLAEAQETALVDLPAEACTRPEPVILRQALRPLISPEPAAPESLPHTPTLGSLAAELPVLPPELIAEMTRRETADNVVCSAPSEECTEPMPAVAPLSPGVALVASRQSDVSELLAGFQVGPQDSHQGLRRAIKEMAELDLTPAPFAALIR